MFTDSTNTVLRFTPTLASQLGTHTFEVTASDSLDQVVGTFTLIISNTGPSFASTPTGGSLSMCTTAAYTFPAVSSFLPATVTAVETSATTLPSFMSFTDSTNTALLINPVSNADIGTKSISVTLDDGISTSSYSFPIIVTNT